MTATVEQTQTELTRLIRLAIGGEEIVITDSGKPVAKLTAVTGPAAKPGVNRREWLEALRVIRSRTQSGKGGRTGDEILAEDRSGRE